MPSVLREHQYELLPPDDEGEGLVFGTEDTGYLTLPRPVHTSGDSTTEDASRALEDGIQFGRDFVGGKSIAFEMGVLTDVNSPLAPASVPLAHRMNLDYLDALEGWWKDPEWRRTPQSVAMLRACEAGRTSRAYGRPRRYDEVVGATTRQGYSNVVCDFQLIDNCWYADDEQMIEVGLAAPPDGGLVAPLVAPLTTTIESEGEVMAVVGGSKATWAIIEFVGPVLNPTLTIGDLTVGLTGTLAYDETVVIDPRPWKRTVLRSTDGASLAGLLSRETPAMRDMVLDPGTHDVLFRGKDSTGSSRARLRWRDARSRP